MECEAPLDHQGLYEEEMLRQGFQKMDKDAASEAIGQIEVCVGSDLPLEAGVVGDEKESKSENESGDRKIAATMSK